MIDDIKTLLGIEDNSRDGILNIYIRRAVTLIKGYLNNSRFDNAYIQDNFQDAIIELVYNAYILKGKENIQTETQGSRSITYKTVTSYADGSTFAITDTIANLLPMPYVRIY